MSAVFSIALRLPLQHFVLDVALETSSRTLGLFGASGSGKTSLVEALSGWRADATGRIAVAGETWLDSTRGVVIPPAARRIGYVPQDLLLFPHLDVEANVRFGARAGDPIVERALELLEIAPLRRRDVATLSGGERQRVALARALCARPRVLVLDEPLGALDRPLRRRVLPYVLRVRDELGVPLVLVSHDPTELAACCTHVVVLARGCVVAQGAPADVLPGAARADDEAEELENVLRGRVEHVDDLGARVELGGARLDVPRGAFAPGDHAILSLRADDVLVATERPRGLSARNVIEACLQDVAIEGDVARLRARLGAGDQCVRVDVTPAAVRELDLTPGRTVFLVIKTRSVRVLATER